MKETMINGPHSKWDEHVLVVFSVLAGLSFAEAFNVLASSDFRITEIILSVAVFYIVLDNWYFLHKDLAAIDLVWPSEVVLYLLSLLTYACLPYLYGVRSNLPANLGPPEWMLINLLLICLIDAIRKTVTLIRLRQDASETVDESEKKLAGAYVFYSLTGYFYTSLLGIAIAFSVSSGWSLILKSISVVGIWAVIRGIDNVVIPRTADMIARIFLGGASTVEPKMG